MVSLVWRTTELKWLWCQWSFSCLLTIQRDYTETRAVFFFFPFSFSITDPLLSHEQCMQKNTEVYFTTNLECCNRLANQTLHRTSGLENRWMENGWKCRLTFLRYIICTRLYMPWNTNSHEIKFTDSKLYEK